MLYRMSLLKQRLAYRIWLNFAWLFRKAWSPSQHGIQQLPQPPRTALHPHLGNISQPNENMHVLQWARQRQPREGPGTLQYSPYLHQAWASYMNIKRLVNCSAGAAEVGGVCRGGREREREEKSYMIQRHNVRRLYQRNGFIRSSLWQFSFNHFVPFKWLYLGLLI